MPLPDPSEFDIDDLVDKPEGIEFEDLLKLYLLSTEDDAEVMRILKRVGGSYPVDNKGRWLIRCPCLNRDAYCGIWPYKDEDGTMRRVCTTPLYKENSFWKWLWEDMAGTDNCPYSSNRLNQQPDEIPDVFK